MPIAARFHELRDRVVATVDEKLAEPVRLSFMMAGRIDPGRERRQIEAILRTGADKESSVAGGVDRSWMTKIAAGQSMLYIDRSKYPDVVIAKGDAVRAISRPGEPVFEVAFVDDRDHTRLVVGLGQK